MESKKYCEFCGASLQEGWQFCDNCGKPVKDPIKIPEASQEVVSMAETDPPEIELPRKPAKKTSWIIPALGFGCLGMVIITGLVIGGFFLFRDQLFPRLTQSSTNMTPEGDGIQTITEQAQVTEMSVTEGSVITLEPSATVTPEFTSTIPIPETSIPTSTSEPSPIPTATSDSLLTGSQYIDETYLYDDFSSDALGWTVYDDGVTITKYEEDAFSIQVKQQNTFDWVYLPVDFVPYEMNFDVRSFDGPQDGTFGVLCQYQDVDNYYYVEIDLLTKEYTIAQSLNDEFIPLTPLNENGQYWQPADQLNEPPTEINQIGVSCYLDIIGLFINNEFVDSVTVDQPFNEPGQAALFVYAFDFAGEAGYKVFFDNVEAFQPVQ